EEVGEVGGVRHARRAGGEGGRRGRCRGTAEHCLVPVGGGPAMSDPAEPHGLTPEQVVPLERICDRFEGAWRAGGSPRIEDELAAMRGPGRQALLRELLEVELAYRRRRGDRPEGSEYLDRFPDGPDVVLAAFGEAPSPRTAAGAPAVRRAVEDSATDRGPGGEARTVATGPGSTTGAGLTVDGTLTSDEEGGRGPTGVEASFGTAA